MLYFKLEDFNSKRLKQEIKDNIDTCNSFVINDGGDIRLDVTIDKRGKLNSYATLTKLKKVTPKQYIDDYSYQEVSVKRFLYLNHSQLSAIIRLSLNNTLII